MKKKIISECAIIGFDHGLPCRVKNMALWPQLRLKPRPSASVFVYWVPRAMFFTRHGRPWSNPTTQHNNCNDNISVRIALINDTPYLALGMFFVSCTKKNNCNIVRALCFASNSSLHTVNHMQDTSFFNKFHFTTTNVKDSSRYQIILFEVVSEIYHTACWPCNCVSIGF